jgi:cobyrinic acid a,c-diamide synthase
LDQGLLRLELQCSRAEPPQVGCEMLGNLGETAEMRKNMKKSMENGEKNVANHGGLLIFVKKSSNISGKMIDNGYIVDM